MAFALAPVIVEYFAVSMATAEMISLGITLVASAVIAKLLAPDIPQAPHLPVANIQVSASTNNKLPVVYGECYVGGTIVDVSITSNYQNLYYVLAICEVTGATSTTDNITIDAIFYGGKRAIFNGYSFNNLGVTVASKSSNTIVASGSLPSYLTVGDSITFNNIGLPTIFYIQAINLTTNTITFSTPIPYYVNVGNTIYQFIDNITSTQIRGLQDPSTGEVDSSFYNTTTGTSDINIYLYSNGSNSPINTGQSAIFVMQNSSLSYQWDSTKLMTNTVFAIVQLTYNSNAGVTGLLETQFRVNNPRNNAGDVIYDYLTNTVYGGAIPSSQIDTTSLNNLTTYCNQTITFNDYLGNPQTQQRFKMNGVIDTTQSVLNNIQAIANCCDCIIKYNEIYGTWSAITQSTTYTVVQDLNDSNIIGSLSITSMDISNTYNIAECQFPDITLNSSFNTSTVNLFIVDPALLYPNEPQNSQSIQLPLCNNNVQAQLLATRFLKQARLDLQVQCIVNFTGLQFEAGDVVTITNANYGWVAKLFQIFKVEQNFGADGQVTVNLTLQEYDPNVFADVSITQYTPPPLTGLQSSVIFGSLTAPVISNFSPYAPQPYFNVTVTTSSQGIIQYAEIYYSSYSNPTDSQVIFAGTTQVQPAGSTYGNGVTMPPVTLTNIPSGNWYIFAKMVNSVAKSSLSPASTLVQWRPTTLQFSQRYLSVAYADDITGTGFSLSPVGKSYYGLVNQSSTAVDITVSDYTWYPAPTSFGSTNYLLYINYGNKLIGFSVGVANISSGGGSFVPSDTTTYDPSIWLGLNYGTNIIDLNYRTGQVIQTGTTSTSTGELNIINNPEGLLQASLAQLLTFPGGASTYTSSVATLTVDVYGRVIGFQAPDSFYYTMTAHIATAGQTIFTITRGTEYTAGNSLVFQNGLFLDPSQWTDGSGQITLAVGANFDDVVTIISMASVSASTSTTYNSFTINAVTLSNQANYTCSGFTLVSGNELLFLNGTVINSQDYNISGQTISFNTAVSGDLQVLQWSDNNQSQPNGNPQNVDTYTVIGQSLYPFSFNPLAFNLYNNGVLLLETTDYTVTTGSYTLSQTPTSNLNILVEQTFNRTGAV